MKAIYLIAAILMGGITGCGKTPEPVPVAKPQTPAPAPAPKPAPSTLQTVVDGFTGRAVVEQGKAAGEKTKAIRAKEQADLNEVMN
jgi:hypothetical protein